MSAERHHAVEPRRLRRFPYVDANAATYPRSCGRLADRFPPWQRIQGTSTEVEQLPPVALGRPRLGWEIARALARRAMCSAITSTHSPASRTSPPRPSGRACAA